MLLKRPVEANEIDSVIAELDDIDIAELVKRQSVIKIPGNVRENGSEGSGFLGNYQFP